MAKPTAKTTPRRGGADATGEKQRELQREQDSKDEAKARQGAKSEKKSGAGQSSLTGVLPSSRPVSASSRWRSAPAATFDE